MRKLRLIISVSALFVLAGCNMNVTTNAFTLSKDGFTALVTYVGSDTWTYDITGSVPSPCYSLNVTTSVTTDNSKANISLTVVAPSKDEVCAKVVSLKEEQGSFTAAETAKLTMTVDNSN